MDNHVVNSGGTPSEGNAHANKKKKHPSISEERKRLKKCNPHGRYRPMRSTSETFPDNMSEHALTHQKPGRKLLHTIATA